MFNRPQCGDGVILHLNKPEMTFNFSQTEIIFIILTIYELDSHVNVIVKDVHTFPLVDVLHSQSFPALYIPK